MDRLGIKSQRGEIFHTDPDCPWALSRLLYKGYCVSFPWVKWPQHGIDPPPPSSTEVEGSGEVHLYSTARPS